MSNRSFFLKTGETENKAFDHPLGLKSSLHIGTNVIEAKYMYMGLGYSPRTSPPLSHFPLGISLLGHFSRLGISLPMNTM